jgi:biotin-[acetyl-CoA-carboxylase] ligase BirA-like protein
MQAFPYESVDSTNEMAKRLIREPGFAGPAYVLAREQTAGKGTRGRKWASPKDAGLYLSVIETPAGVPASETNGIELTAFTLAAGVACVECLQRLFGIRLQLKPVNDLYVDECKLGGILTEAVIERGRMTALITGIGVNTSHAERPICGSNIKPISLQELLGPSAVAALDMAALADAIAADVHALNLSVIRGEVECIRWAWDQHRMVTAELGR